VARVAVRLPAPGASAGTGAKPAGDGAESPTADAHAVLQIQRFVHGPSGALMQARSWQAELPHIAAPMAQPAASAPGQGAAAGRSMSLAERWLALDTPPLLALLERPGDPAIAEVSTALQAHRLAMDSRVALARDAFGRLCGETQTLYRQAGTQAPSTGGEPPIEFEHTIAHTLGPLGQRTATQAQGLGMLQWLAYGSGHVHGLLLDGQPVVDWERDALHREVGRTLHILEGQGNEDLPAIVHARQLDPMGRMLRQDWRGLRHEAAMGDAVSATGSETGPSSAAGRIAPALGPLATLAQRRYSYDPLGQLVGVQTPGEATRYGYDAWQRLTGLHRAGQGVPEMQEHWALDAAGNRLPTVLDARAAGVSNAERQDWEQQVRENLHDAGFDLLRAGDGGGEVAGPVTRWPGNRIGWSAARRPDDGKGIGTTRYRYDAFGNRIQALFPDGRAQQLRYDALHQLREVWQRDGAGSPWHQIASYRYDAFGRRLGKTVHQRTGLEGSATYAGWDADRLVHTEGSAGLVHTLYEPDSFVPLLRLERERAIPSAIQTLLAPPEDEDIEEGSGQPADLFAALPRSQRELLENTLAAALASGHGALTAPQLPVELRTMLAAGLDEMRHRQATFTKAHSTRIRHMLCDHLGTPIALVDANGFDAGLVTWAATHHAWGSVREEYDPHGAEQAIRFQGQQLDSETGLHYNRFRYYDPEVGQYVTQDPIGLNGGVNKSIYPVNPNSKIDPLGLKDKEGGFFSNLFGWGGKASSTKDAIDVGKMMIENKNMEKEIRKLEAHLEDCILKSPTCRTEEMQKTEDSINELRKNMLKNTAEITKVMMETPGTSAGGPIHIPGMKP